jgi:ribosomal protein L11 methyltransferase
MPWLQLSVTTSKQHSEQVESILLEQGACSITYRDADDVPILEPAPGETPLWENSIVTGLFECDVDSDALLASLNIALSDCEVSISTDLLQDQNWTRAWMDHFKAMQFGQRLWVVPTHLDATDPQAVNLRLDPGLAFGTGTHPTTELCLRWLDAHANAQQNALDYGCGSGILAIAALLLGVNQVDGVDIDPQAIEASRSNARINKVAQQLELFLVEDFSPRQYDLVLANILSGPLAELAPLLAACTRTGGDIVLSGILREQADSVREVYAEYFVMDEAVIEQDWVMLHGCRQA